MRRSATRGPTELSQPGSPHDLVEPQVVEALAERRLRDEQREVQLAHPDRPERATDGRDAPVHGQRELALLPTVPPEPAEHVRRDAPPVQIDVDEAASGPEARSRRLDNLNHG